MEKIYLLVCDSLSTKVFSCAEPCKKVIDKTTNPCNVEIVGIICHTIVSLAVIAAATILLYYIIKRISDGIRRKSEVKNKYKEEIVGYIKKKAENGNSIENDAYLAELEKYVKCGCCHKK